MIKNTDHQTCITRCEDCGRESPKDQMHRVFKFEDEDGVPCLICSECFDEHEEKGDWCS